MTKRRVTTTSKHVREDGNNIPIQPEPAAPRKDKTPPAGAASTTLPRGIRPLSLEEYGNTYVIGGQAPRRRWEQAKRGEGYRAMRGHGAATPWNEDANQASTFS
jgi:hypothetical protein